MQRVMTKSSRSETSPRTTGKNLTLGDEAKNNSQGITSFKRAIAVPKKFTSGFCDVDRSDNLSTYLTYVNRFNAHELSRFSKRELFKRILRPRTGEHILDIGCGAGHDAHALARLVGRNGHVVGIDRSKTMIRAAQRRIQGQKCALEFRVCDAHHLKFPDNTFDACLAIGTLVFMENPSQVLTEVFRVLKPGGRLTVQESDWDSLTITAGNGAMTDTLVKIRQKSVCHSGIGHQLPVLFWQTGFEDTFVGAGTMTLSDYTLANEGWRIEATLDEARKAGAISSKYTRRLLHQLKLASETGKFFGASTSFAVAGITPRVH